MGRQPKATHLSFQHTVSWYFFAPHLMWRRRNIKALACRCFVAYSGGRTIQTTWQRKETKLTFKKKKRLAVVLWRISASAKNSPTAPCLSDCSDVFCTVGGAAQYRRPSPSAWDWRGPSFPSSTRTLKLWLRLRDRGEASLLGSHQWPSVGCLSHSGLRQQARDSLQGILQGSNERFMMNILNVTDLS